VVYVGFQVVESRVQIVESFVLGPLRDPDRGHQRDHDRQRDGQKQLERRVHPPNMIIVSDSIRAALEMFVLPV
jgi:hypothetical protein